MELYLILLTNSMHIFFQWEFMTFVPLTLSITYFYESAQSLTYFSSLPFFFAYGATDLKFLQFPSPIFGSIPC